MTWRNALRILGGVFLMGTLAMTAGADVWDDVWDLGATQPVQGWHVGTGTANWAGYASTGSNPHPDVRAEWTVPTVSCSTPDAGVGMWVGLDGTSNRFLEQVGVNVICTAGKPDYSGFWEIFPAPAQSLSKFKVGPGDRVFAAVHFDGGKYNLTLANLSNGTGDATSVANPGAPNASAEVIVEAPLSDLNGTLKQPVQLPLANFGEIDFSKIEGLKGTSARVQMATSSGHVLAIAKGSNGNNLKEFDVTWIAAS